MDKIKVFLSWSGDTSRQVAKILKEWLPVIFQQIDPWMSEKDIEAGARWQEEILKNLSESHFGIICITPDNLSSKWLHFEAGALVKHLQSKVVPLLYNVSRADLEEPLKMFQAKSIFSKDDMLSVVGSIYNSFQGEKISFEIIQRSFELNWEKLQKELEDIKQLPSKDNKSRKTKKSQKEKILEGILEELDDLKFEILHLRDVLEEMREKITSPVSQVSQSIHEPDLFSSTLKEILQKLKSHIPQLYNEDEGEIEENLSQ